MARMIPARGPQDTDSRGEEKIYDLLKQGLPDEFTVIHSFPWLASDVKKIDPKYAPTGEIDFLIIHESLGLLTLEVKGGVQRVEDGLFIYVRTGGSNNHLQQMRKNMHGLAQWLGSGSELYLRIGYGLIVPDSVFGEDAKIPGFVDPTVTPHQSLLIDRMSMDASALADRIRQLMAYWKKTLNNPVLGADRTTRLIDALCPTYDGTPTWGNRVEYDNRIWLRLTQEQASVVHTVMAQTCMVVTGWPGTGKTLIAIEIARRNIIQGKRVLILTFNKLLVNYLRREVDCGTTSKVVSWHGFCSAFARMLGRQSEETEKWREQGCLEDLQAALEQGLVPDFDVLILDEAQALRPEWFSCLASHFAGKPIIAFCDETQRFSFEKARISTEELCKQLKVGRPFSLTIPLRSPRHVLDRLQNVRPPSYQMFSPRDLEEDTLQERVVAVVDTAIDEVIAELTAKGIDRADIVVLSRFGWSENGASAERYETVARFRGMEAPAVIIAGADDMDEFDLFCAYSRATTVCIALYEAEPLGCKPSPGKFQELVLENPENASLAYEAREQGLTRFILARHVESASIGLSSVDLSWCETWRCWFIDRQDDTEAAALWIDYLLTYHDWPVYSWTSLSRRKIEHGYPVANETEINFSTTTDDLSWCNPCAAPTPHKRQRDATLACQRCANSFKEQPTPSSEMLALMKKFDAVICSPNPSSLPREERDRLPLPLAALGARRYVATRSQGVPAKLAQLPASSVLRRWSTAFIYSRISMLSVGTKIERDMLAHETGRYVLPEGLTQEAWRGAISRSLGMTAKSDLLIKPKDGIYETIIIN